MFKRFTINKKFFAKSIFGFGCLGFGYTFYAKEHSDATYIHTFAHIQDVLRQANYSGAEKFPQLIVIGDQSSGKSSLLESIIGISFIPKGEGTVTKRPLVITLHHQDGKVYATFPQLNITTSDFKQVEQIIRKNNENFTSEPLNLDIYSPKVVDLRLVDLPGLIQIPKKDQPKDLRDIIKNICTPYVENPNSIIIAVSAGNTDIQTSESLRFAKKFDPNGKRTISVLTKLDILPKGSIKDLIKTINQFPLTLGFVGVRCRSKEEVENGISLEEARNIEKRFFDTNPELNIPSSTEYLVIKLNKILQEKIQEQLFNILNDLTKDLRAYQLEIQKIGGEITPKAQKELEKELLKLTKKYLDEVFDIVKIEEVKRDLAQMVYTTITNECDNELYNNEISKRIIKTVETPDELNHWWLRSESEEYFLWSQYVLNILNRLKPLGENSISLLMDDLKKRINKEDSLKEYPYLDELIKSSCHNYLNVSYKRLTDSIEFLVSLEQNIRPDDYAINEQLKRVQARRKKKYEENKTTLKSSTLTPQEKEMLNKQQDLLYKTYKQSSMKRFDDLYTEGYILEVAVRLSNNIFNAVCIDVLNQIKHNLQIEITHSLFNTPNKEKYLEQSENTKSKREELSKKIKALNESIEKLQKLTDQIR